MKFNATATEEVSSQAGRPCLPAVQPEQGSPGAWPCSHAPHPALAPEDRFNLQCPASWACWGKRGPEPCSAPKAEWPALQRVAEASPSCPGTRGARITCRERKEARLAGADGDQQLSPFWPSWTHTYAEHSPPPQSRVSVKRGPGGRGVPPECLCLLAGSLGMRPELQAGSSSLHPPSGTQTTGQRWRARSAPQPLGTHWQLRVRSPSWLSPFPPGGAKNSCGLPRSGKVVGVGLDLPAELAGQSGYSSARSQGNSWSMWGKGGG